MREGSWVSQWVRGCQVICFLGFLAALTMTASAAAVDALHESSNLSVSLMRQPAGKPYVGDTLTMEAVIRASADDDLEYQFLVDDVVIQPWSKTPSCQLILDKSHVGPHHLTVQMRRRDDIIAQATDHIYVLHPPIEFPDRHASQTTR